MNDYTPSVKDIIETWAIATPNRGMSVPDRMRAAERAVAAHDAGVRAGVVAEEPEWGVWDQRDRVFRHVHPPTEENARRESALGGADFEATRALPWVPVKQEGAGHEGDS